MVWKLTLQARETNLLGEHSLSIKGKEDINEEGGFLYILHLQALLSPLNCFWLKMMLT